MPLDLPPPPEPGAPPVRLADDLLWMRLPLPFALTHVNVFLLRDGEGWLGVDCGVASDRAKAAWEQALAVIGGPHRLTRLLVTHHHVDHVGLAAWLQRETGCETLMSAPEEAALDEGLRPAAPGRRELLRAHWVRMGCDEAEADGLMRQRFHATMFVEGRPERIRRLAEGETLAIGRSRWTVGFGGGHTVASAMLFEETGGRVVGGDQILTPISPFIGTWMDDPFADPLGDYFAFLRGVAPRIGDDALVLPGHGLPFRAAAARCAALLDHHEARCEAIVAAVAHGPKSIRQLVGALFTRKLDGVLGMAMAETLAHANRVAAEGRITMDRDGATLTCSRPR